MYKKIFKVFYFCSYLGTNRKIRRMKKTLSCPYTGATTCFIYLLELGKVVLYRYDIYDMSSLIVTIHSHSVNNTVHSHHINYLNNNIDINIMVE